MLDLIDSMLTMQLDLYRQYEQQDPDTGAMKREWQYQRTLDCYAKGIISNSTTSRSSDKQIFNNKYTNEQVIQVRTSERITMRDKITNIRDVNGNVIWTELNYPSETPTVFEVVGVTPITDPFGNTLGYNSSMRRSENQQIGI
jgi:hypothetical protein